MSDVIVLKDGHRVYITQPDDFGLLLEREVGPYAKEYFDGIVAQNAMLEDEIWGAARYECDKMLNCIHEDLRQFLLIRPLEGSKIIDLMGKIEKMQKDMTDKWRA